MQVQAYRHILWATDLSEGCESIGARATDIAQRHGARLSAAHIVAYVAPFEIGGELMLPPYPEIEQLLVKQATQRLAKFAAQFGVTEEAQYVLVGSPRGDIVRIAKEKNVDLIVVGRHRRHGLGLLLGSTANGVIHGATCDVLAVKA